MKYWLLSDPHFHHEMMLLGKYRPDDYAEKIFKGLQQIPEEDTLICLGDITIGNDQETHDKFIKPLKCRKILVKGNHDKKSNAWYMSNGWDFVCRDFYDELFGRKIIFTHCPIKAPEGTINIHGHLHTRDHRGDPAFEGCHLVSCELQGYRPQTLESFLKHIEKDKKELKFHCIKCGTEMKQQTGSFPVYICNACTVKNIRDFTSSNKKDE